MSDTADLPRDSVKLILRLLRDGLEPGVFKEFYDGDPDFIPDFNLPCIVVEQLRDTTVGGTFGQDDVTDTVLVKVIYSKLDDASTDLDPQNTTSTRVRRAINARDEATGDYLPATVKGVLRPNVYGTRRIGHELTVEFGAQLRPGPERQTITSEGHVTVPVLYSVDVATN